MRTTPREARAATALPHLVLIPGLLNDADLWRDQIAALDGIATCEVADITGGQTMRELSESVLADAPERFWLVGFSLGGFVAQDIVRAAPERILGLALMDTSIRPDTPERIASRRAMDAAALTPGKFHGFGDRLLGTYLDPSNIGNHEIIGRIRAMTERLGPEVFVRQNNLERLDGTEVLRGFGGPMLILCGASDRLTPLADHQAMAQLAPQAHLVVVPDSGHMTPLENPDAVSDALKAWLSAAGGH